MRGRDLHKSCSGLEHGYKDPFLVRKGKESLDFRMILGKPRRKEVKSDRLKRNPTRWPRAGGGRWLGPALRLKGTRLSRSHRGSSLAWGADGHACESTLQCKARVPRNHASVLSATCLDAQQCFLSTWLSSAVYTATALQPPLQPTADF